MYSRKIFLTLAVICILFLFSCGPKPVAPKAELDTPGHHVKNGMKLLKSGKIDNALSEFERAKALDPEYSPAFVGIGLVNGCKGSFENGLDAMKTAAKYAKGNEQEFLVNTGYMRLYIMGKEKIDRDWLELVEKRFKKAHNIYPDLPEPYYYMGVAYKMSYRFHESAKMFEGVLEIGNGFMEEADREYEIVQKIERAMPGSINGKKIALLKKISRGDVAALFIEELRVDELFKNRTPKKFDTSFKSPEKAFVTGEYVKIPPATDIADHVLKVDIEAVIEVGIKGLQPFPDHTFKPYKDITRAEYAMMMEDLLIKITGVDQLATRFIGSVSPFPDLRNDLPYFNAVMICTTRGIMVADFSSGEFNAMGTVSGADALLGIRQLKIQLGKF